MASQRADIGRYEARCGVPRPPPQPTGTMGPPGPCPVPLAPWGDAQAPEPRPIQQAARSAVSLVWPCVGDLHPPTHLGWEWEVPTTPGATMGHWGGVGRVSRRWGASMAKKSLQWVVLGQNPSEGQEYSTRAKLRTLVQVNPPPRPPPGHPPRKPAALPFPPAPPPSPPSCPTPLRAQPSAGLIPLFPPTARRGGGAWPRAGRQQPQQPSV